MSVKKSTDHKKIFIYMDHLPQGDSFFSKINFKSSWDFY